MAAPDRIDCRTVERIDPGSRHIRIEPGKRYVHPNAVGTGTCGEGCCDIYECPDCGTIWTVEAPQ